MVYPYFLFQSVIFTAICIAQSASANHGLIYTSVQLCSLLIFTICYAYIKKNFGVYTFNVREHSSYILNCTLINLFGGSMYHEIDFLQWYKNINILLLVYGNNINPIFSFRKIDKIMKRVKISEE
jgi:hypothetical protein